VLIVKPNGQLHPRVQKVGPEHFGIVTVDPGKASSTWMLADFYGRVLRFAQNDIVAASEPCSLKGDAPLAAARPPRYNAAASAVPGGRLDTPVAEIPTSQTRVRTGRWTL